MRGARLGRPGFSRIAVRVQGWVAMSRKRMVVRWASRLAILGILATLFAAAPASQASAVRAIDFDPGYIISDAIFINANSMSEAAVQSFLVVRVPSCAGLNGQPCLRNFISDTVSRPASPGGQCRAYEGAPAEPASRIIVKVAQACGINPQVLLATLEKERGLVTKTSPNAADYKVSMGYGCPDTAACDTAYYGFYNQVYRAAWQFREYTLRPSAWRYRIGATSIQWHPNAACGASTVTIRNQATANLYNYTPYQPNAAALSNLRGLGDACSSYGNRNFWVNFSLWFGSPVGLVNPVGSLDVVSQTPGQLRLAGWVFDPDSTEPTDIHVYVNGIGRAYTAANARPDLAAVYGPIGANHGFDVSVPIESLGVQNVCVYGINQGPGANSLISCRSFAPFSGNPLGVIDTASAAPGAIGVTGWVIDPDTPLSTSVHVYVDGAAYGVVADGSRPDVATAYPGYGPSHGYSFTIPATPGNHTVCVYGINGGLGSNVLLGCRVVSVPTGSPIGVLDSVTVAPGSFTVSGWTFDRDTAQSIPVHIYAGSQGIASFANRSRPDVAAAYPGYGASHGYSATQSATPGTLNVCAYGIESAGTGSNTLLGCRAVTMMSGSPVGVIDSVSAAGGVITTSGWAFDQDSADAISVTVSIDGAPSEVLAMAARSDVGAVYPAYGPLHGYSTSTPASAGTHQVCVTAMNVGPGADTLLGCRTVLV